MKPITEFPHYTEKVLHELEILGFDVETTVACIMGVPETALAHYMNLMMRASFLSDESPTKCATQIRNGFLRAFDDAMMKIVMENINFPSE